MNRRVLVILTALAATSCGGGGGGYGGSSPTAPSGNTPPSGPTVTISSSGVSPNVIRIDRNQSVRFVNNASRMIQIHSDPHPTGEMCPPLNQLPALQPGQSANTGAFTLDGTCTYHNHNEPDNSALRGTILVNVNEPGPTPGYQRTQ